MMADPPILSCKSSRNTMYILLTISFIIKPSLAQSLNVALNKTVSQSSTLEYPDDNFWNAERAVDGIIPPGVNDTDKCPCCSSTNSVSNNSLTLDLGEIYNIDSIYVLGRQDSNNGRLKLVNLYISNTTPIASSAIYNHAQTTQNFTWNASEVTFARYVKLFQPNDDYLIVCELKVFKRDCPDGKYGSICTQDCINCATCNQTDGQCLICIDGKYGVACQQDCSVNCSGSTCKKDGGRCNICNDGKYGDTCQHNCSASCAEPSCDRNSGQCITCIDRKYGHTCQHNCSASCAEPSCDRINGNCSTCTKGKYGDTCQQKCSVNCDGRTCEKDSGHCNTCVGGKYGDKCSNNCSPQCEGNVCDRMDGHCMAGCKPGYTGDNCDSPCPDGSYGNNCAATCGHCSEAAKCNKTDGICMTGCLPGYKPWNCTEGTCIHKHFIKPFIKT